MYHVAQYDTREGQRRMDSCGGHRRIRHGISFRRYLEAAVQSLELKRLRGVWEKIRNDPDGRRALDKLARDGFKITHLSPQGTTPQALNWAAWIAALPFLPDKATRRQLHRRAELRKYWPLIPALRGLALKMSDPFSEVVVQSRKDLPPNEIRSIPKRLLETADFLEQFFSWDWSTRERNSRNTVIAVLRSEIRSRTGRPHDIELSALVDCAFRAAGREEGCCIDATALDRMERREMESRVKARRRLRSLGGGPYWFFP